MAAQAAGAIADTTIATPDPFTCLAAEARLINALSSPGRFTVYAPTNEAFAALPAGVVDNLPKPENKAQLDDVLTYVAEHKAQARRTPRNGESVKTVEGKTLAVSASAKGVPINNAQVVTADVDASNGAVHIINAVLLPAAAPTSAPAAPTPAPAGKTIVDLAVANPDPSTLVTALKAGDLVATLYIDGGGGGNNCRSSSSTTSTAAATGGAGVAPPPHPRRVMRCCAGQPDAARRSPPAAARSTAATRAAAVAAPARAAICARAFPRLPHATPYDPHDPPRPPRERASVLNRGDPPPPDTRRPFTYKPQQATTNNPGTSRS